MTDPFDTAGLRSATLAAWAGSPTRFREDANAEEDLLLGGYADRWLVELAQNAADAARRAGSPGQLLVRVVDGELRVANTGAPLDSAGVAALASLRASAKRDSAAVGRFGVGFAAVLGVTDRPRVVSDTGGVEFSAERTVAEVAALGGVAAAELRRRSGRPPVLRLCWPVPSDEPPPPPGYQTEVRLPPRAGVDTERLLAAAHADATDLLLALPWLAELTVIGPEPVTYRREDHSDGSVTLWPAGERWLLAGRSGQWVGPAEHAEERASWSVCWAVPVDAEGRPRPLEADVLHAPTPSDERLALPARLLADLPMQPNRRRVRAGPRADAVLAEAALAYRDLVLALPAAERIALAPRPGFPVSELDGRLRALIGAALTESAWLPSAAGADIRPTEAVVLDLSGPPVPELTELLADVVPGLLADSAAAAPRPVLAALEVNRLSLAELTDRLAALRRPPEWWRRLYAALAGAVEGSPTARDELAALPVPLVDGRTVSGPRTAVALVGADAAVLADVELPGLRILHPAAAHPLLTRLGTAEVGPAELLDHPSVAEAVTRSVELAEDGLDTGPLARLVLGLLAEVAGPSGLPARPWVAGLALPDTDGEPRRADELMLPDAALAPLLVPDAPIGVLAESVVGAYPREVLTAAGVLDSFAVLVDELPTGPDHDLADEEQWWAGLVEPPAPLVAVRDLDLVAEDAWPAALGVLAELFDRVPGEYRAALWDPDGYTLWWLARHARLAGRRPGHWRLPGADALTGLYDELPVSGRRELLAAIGVRSGLAIADTDQAADLLARLADPARTPDAALAWAAHAELAEAVLAGRVDLEALEPPERLRASDGSVVDAGRAVLLDRSWLAAVLPVEETVAGRLDADGVDALAELLDLPLASEVVAGRVDSTGRVCRWAELPEVVASCAALGVPVPDGELELHERLTVALVRPRPRRLEVPVWWQDGWWHVADPVRALLAVLGGAEQP